MLGDTKRLAAKKSWAIHLLKDQPKPIQDSVCDMMNLINGSEMVFANLVAAETRKKKSIELESDWGDLGDESGSDWGSLCDEIVAPPPPKEARSDHNPITPDPIIDQEFVDACQKEMDAMTPLSKGKPLESGSSSKLPSCPKILFHTGNLSKKELSSDVKMDPSLSAKTESPISAKMEPSMNVKLESSKEAAVPMKSCKTDPDTDQPAPSNIIKQESKSLVVHFNHGIKESVSSNATESKTDLPDNRTVLFKTTMNPDVISSSKSTAQSDQLLMAALIQRDCHGPASAKAGAMKRDIKEARKEMREATKLKKEAEKEEKRQQRLAMKSKPKAASKKKENKAVKSGSDIANQDPKSGQILTVRDEASNQADPDAWFYEKIDAVSINYAFQGAERAYLMGRTVSSGPKRRLICEFTKKKDRLYKDFY